MSRTVTALYDTRAEAEAARERLSSAVDVDSARIIDNESRGSGSPLNSVYMSNEDRHAFDEGIRRGGFMLCAEIDNDEDADRIVDILEQTSPVDLDERQQSWKSEGWQGSSASQQQQFGERGQGFGETGRRTVEEERIPIVQEEMKIGKREVERGGARVRSYVRETPVSEQVNLREENVSVERRPVNEAVSENELDTSGMLEDREIEMRATGEEAVIGKDARVTEELVVKKTAEERTQNVQDSVRHTEVDVDSDRETLGSPGRASGGSSSPWGNDGGNR
jgi:uncharacterized protein (TIGR02271 family)